MPHPDFVPKYSASFSDFLEIEQVVLEDDTLVIIFRLLCETISDDSLWELAMKDVRRFLRYIGRTQRHYHFVFDTHRCNMLPVQHLHEFKSVTNTTPDVINAYLRSNVVIVQNRAVHAILNTLLPTLSMRRPYDILQCCVQCDAVHEHGLPQDAWRVTSDVFKTYRQAASFA